ncbi:MAG: cob(I)yrinic acid a,c-diamide adenosyltransferase [Balneolaceae bacterium]|nr:MAG: cob(I)yrinic acid a,c-diamide adenosyltransferase [Balneolaceae bacterium]
MKIYTKRGDQGTTSLFGGTSIEKSHTRLHAYGTVDELNSVIGMALTNRLSSRGSEILIEIQKQLFVVGADLATLPSKKTKIERVGQAEIEQIESWIDELDEQLPQLTSFILPGGSASGASLHLARTVCRRAERYSVQLMREEGISEDSLIYLNRLSDFLFVLARFENLQSGSAEIKWLPRSS